MTESNKFSSTFAQGQFKEYIKKEEIDVITDSLAHSLNKKYAGEELILVGVLKGSVVFLSELSRRLTEVKVYIDFVDLEAVGRSKENNGTIVIKKDLSTDVLNKNILIVEEIIDTGRALDFLFKRLQLSNPRNIEIVTLFDKPYKRAVPIKANYIGKQINDEFIIGHGLDLEDYGRNLEDLYVLEFPN